MSGVVRQVSEEHPLIFVGQGLVFQVEDNGRPAGAPRDLISDVEFFGARVAGLLLLRTCTCRFEVTSKSGSAHRRSVVEVGVCNDSPASRGFLSVLPAPSASFSYVGKLPPRRG